MIIVEQIFNAQTLTEGEEGKKHMYLQGTFMESEKRNRNGRIYQKSQIEAAVDKINEAASQGRHILGELDHPPTLEVKLANVSHKILEMRMNGNDAVGKAQILDNTPNGQIAKNLAESGIVLGVSSRGAGTVNEESGLVEDFNFITADLVANPSAINAYPSSIMEQLEMYRRGYLVNDLAEAVLHDKKAQKYFEQEIKKFIAETFNK